jgi:60 kDa SS-A/Ro ribonucleoprotein
MNYIDLLPPARDDVTKNSAGGDAFKLDPWDQLVRFLILGSSSGTYYASAQDLTMSNLAVVSLCLIEDPVRAVNLIAEISKGGRAPKQSPGLVALALAVVTSPEAATEVWRVLPEVARTPTSLFEFVTYLQRYRDGKWNRSQRRGVANWFTSKAPAQLAYQAGKYRQRDGWTLADVLRLSHPNTGDPELDAVFGWICGKDKEANGLPRILRGYDAAKNASSPQESASLVAEFGLPWEAIKSEHLNAVGVWEALLDAPNGIPQTALLRQLPRLTRLGLLRPGYRLGQVVDQLTNQELIMKSRLHPLAILNAKVAYAFGFSRGGVMWDPEAKIISALDKAFRLAFGNVTPTGKSTLLAIDCSPSMWGQMIAGTSLTAADAAGAMAVVTDAVESDCTIVGFSSRSGTTGYRVGSYDRSGIAPLNISADMSLAEVSKNMCAYPWSGTDCALPMIYARENKLKIDTFVIYTDNETWAGKLTPSQALCDYRRSSGIDAKLVVVGCTSTGFTIADPRDTGMLDVVGFDTATPNLISAFSSGLLSAS